MTETDHDEPIPPRLRARSTTQFHDRYRCTNCRAPLDLADPQMYTCTGCGALNDPAALPPGRILVGEDDIVTFRYYRRTLTGIATKVNRRSLAVRYPDTPGITRTVTPEKVVSVTFAHPDPEED